MFQSDAVSNYNGLQVYLTKRKGDFSLIGIYTRNAECGFKKGRCLSIRNPKSAFRNRQVLTCGYPQLQLAIN